MRKLNGLYLSIAGLVASGAATPAFAGDECVDYTEYLYPDAPLPILQEPVEAELVGSVLYLLTDGPGPSSPNRCLDAYDVSVPDVPISIGHLCGLESAFDLTASDSGTHLFTIGFGSLVVVDVTDPSTPVVANSVSHNTTYMDADGDRLVTARGGAIEEIAFFDITEPAAPVLRSVLPVEGSHVRIRGDYVYVSQPNALAIIDVSNLDVPVVVSSVDIPAISLERYSDIELYGDYVVMAGSDALFVFDVSAPTAPTLSQTIPSHLRLFDLDIHGTIAIAGDKGFIQTFDLADPQNVARIGWTSTCLNTSGTSIVADNGWAYVAGAHRYMIDPFTYVVDPYLTLVDLAQPSSPSEFGSLLTPNEHEQTRVSLHGDLAVLTHLFDRIDFVDISKPELPVLTGSFDPPLTVSDAEVWSSFLFVLGFADQYEVQVFRDQGKGYEQIRTLVLPSAGLDLELHGNVLLSHSPGSDLVVIDAGNPTLCYVASSIPGVEAFAPLGTRHVLVTDDAGFLRVWDLVDPTAPIEVGSVILPGSGDGIATDGTLAVVAGAASGLVTIDVTDFSSPQIIGTHADTAIWGKDLMLSGNTVYVRRVGCEGPRRMGLFDVSDAANPVPIDAQLFPVPVAGDVKAHDGLIYVAGETPLGFRVVPAHCRAAVGIGDIAGPAIGPRLTASPTPFSHRATLSFVATSSDLAVISVFDSSGRRIRVLAERRLDVGTNVFSWDGTDDRGYRTAPGVYFVKLETPAMTSSSKLVFAP